MNLANTIRDAIAERDTLKAKGLDALELAKGFEAVVRQVWPFTRAWHYLCEDCRDTGLEIVVCVGAGGLCGRRQEHTAHEYGRPCWCKKGAAFRAPEVTPDDAIAKAAKVSKPSRFGR